MPLIVLYCKGCTQKSSNCIVELKVNLELLKYMIRKLYLTILAILWIYPKSMVSSGSLHMSVCNSSNYYSK